jgi:peptidoglycan/LPS O-acetylase OafA/YrhL
VNSARSNGKNLDIEVLRGVAVIYAVFSHFGNLLLWDSPICRGVMQYALTWVGVDLFFCISGYVIALSILNDLPAVRIPLRQHGVEIGERFRLRAKTVPRLAEGSAAAPPLPQT